MMNATSMIIPAAGFGDSKAPGQRSPDGSGGMFGLALAQQQSQGKGGQQEAMLHSATAGMSQQMSPQQLDRAISQLADFGLPTDFQLNLQAGEAGASEETLMAALAGLLTQIEQLMDSSPEGLDEDNLNQLDALVQTLMTELSPEALQGEDGEGLQQLKQMIDSLQQMVIAEAATVEVEVETAETKAAEVETASIAATETETSEAQEKGNSNAQPQQEVVERLLAVAQRLQDASDQAVQAEGRETAAQRLTALAEQLKSLAEDAESTQVVVQQAQTKGVAADQGASQGFVPAAGDARFGDLLKPRSGEASLSHQQHMAKELTQAPKTEQPLAEEESFADLLSQKSMGKPTVESAGMTNVQLAQQLGAAKFNQVLDGSQGQQHFNNTPLGQPAASGLGVMGAVAQVAGQPAAMPQAGDSQIFDQVVTHLSGSASGETGRMVLRLHPAELGALRIELMVEGDQLRANLHAQTQQVQEVLERNLNQLRNALAEQGLKIDQFQVTSDARQQQNTGTSEDLAHQRQSAQDAADAAREQQDMTPEDQNLSLAHLLQNGGSGISLRV